MIGILTICDGDAEYGMKEMVRTRRCERGGLEGFGDLMCGWMVLNKVNLQGQTQDWLTN